jgi:2',3'-cyclic-nucleotide 2'-phosphodiesterase (5'-nucleotidase family)
MAEARFPVLAANLADESGAAIPGIGATKIVEVDGVKIGLVGLTADDSAEKSNPGTLRISSTVDALRRLAPELRRQGADLVVAVVHANRREDLRLYLAHDADVILSGDDHDLAILYDGKTAFAEGVSEGEALVAIDLDIRVAEREGERAVDWRPRFRIVDTADVTPDPEMATEVARHEAVLSKNLDVLVGRTETALDTSKALVRSAETAFGNLVADALRETLGADIAIYNGGGIRGNRTYGAGTDLFRRDVLTELPFANRGVVVKLSGADLRAVIENGLTFAGKPAGRFLQVSGMTVVASLDAVPGSKVKEIRIGGGPLDPLHLYKVATNDFVAAGKEGFDLIAAAERVVRELDAALVSQIVMDYIAARRTIAPKVEGRIRLE